MNSISSLMSYTASDKLPEDFFQETIEEKAGDDQEIFKRHRQSFSVFYTHWAKYGNIQILFTSRGGFIETPLYLLKSRGPAGPIILFMGPIELCVKGRVNNIKQIVD